MQAKLLERNISSMTKERKLVAALACRAGGKRLYGKPLQNLDMEVGLTILDHLILGLKACPEIEEIVLGIAEGIENQVFIEYAHKHKISYIIGDEKDVLLRLIQCGRIRKATDIFRITSECPFIAWHLVGKAWEWHLKNKNDVTVTDFLPEGANFEIYKMEALEISHAKGNDYERSEFCSAYIRNHPKDFKIEILKPEDKLARLDLRLTVDYPEDLILCRDIYQVFKDDAPHIPLHKILKHITDNPSLHKIVEPFVDQTPIWAKVISK